VSAPRSIYAAKLLEFSDLACAGDAAFDRRRRWHAFFRDRIGPAHTGRLVFEVGCSDADFLSRVAAKHPDTAFVGLDWKCKAIYDAAARVTRLGLPNVALIRGRAQDVLRIFGPGELDEVWVFHPDPCDKPAELRNRLIAEPFLVDVHGVLRDETSTLTLKTDHPGYYQWTLALLGLPEPDSFAAARDATADRRRSRTAPLAGDAGPATRVPRVRVRDLMPLDALPRPSDAVRRRFEPAAWSDDFWHDPVALAHAAGRPFADELTRFESRFAKRREPIYFVELRRRAGS
jgi:tRNA G46 methylase TrmB